MAKKKSGRDFSHLVKYQFKAKRKKKKARATPHKKGKHMAKRKKKKSTGGRRRRRSHHVRRRVHRGAGITGGGSFTHVDLPLIAAGGFAGFMEKSLKKDGDKSIFNKMPTPVAQVGRTGNAALLAYGAAYVVPAKYKRYARTLARGLAVVAAYQLMRKGESFKEGAELFSISGLHPDALSGGDEQTIDGDDLGDVEDELGRRYRIEADVDTDHHEGEVHPDEIHPDDSAAPPA